MRVGGIMGTRSLTIFLDDRTGYEIVVLYNQHGGNPSGYGYNLANYLKKFIITDGVEFVEGKHTANGMSCLAAQVISNFKEGPGGFYLYPARTRNCGEDYAYTIYKNSLHGVNIYCHDVDEDKVLFDGPADQYENWLDQREKEDKQVCIICGKDNPPYIGGECIKCYSKD